MSPIRSLASAALLSVAALLSACAAVGTPTSPAATSAAANASPALVFFASEEGVARLARSRAKADFAALANQFEAQYNGAFCGPTSAAIVLNTVNIGRGAEVPRDHTRLRKDDVQFMPPGADPIVPRFTQDLVIDKGPKTRAQVLGEPVTIGGKQVRDFGYQLRQFDAMLRGNGLVTRAVVVDDALSEQSIRADMADNLARSGDYVIVNYRREAVGQKGGGHISPVGAYDAASDSFLVLDVNPSAAGWAWIPTATLVKAMRTFDTVENRGYVVVNGP
ncbi:phytochelatin synthase family protein [Variovorax robiniae]|uniref:glutathione gamma-glutamylcysteinyltransferase n=1 Tax=Variovorax robiniae TaxID=1836199 RepID=A0ABU8XCD2_9BURK